MSTALQQLVQRGQTISTDLLNRAAARELQERLCDLGLLDPEISGKVSQAFGPVRKSDGVFGINSRAALYEFCQLAQLPYEDKQLNIPLLTALLSAKPDTFIPIQFESNADDLPSVRLCKRILRYMRAKGFWIARSPNMRNIVYVEGMNPDGSLNKDHFNHWNDRRIVFRIAPGGNPEMLVNDQATTEPGHYYTWRPVDPRGAARIAFGQYKAWALGFHKNNHPALVQRGNVRLHRDINKDGFRSKNDPIVVGKTFGINQHSTLPGTPPERVDTYSAGCLVGRRWDWHLSFLEIVIQDERYRLNRGYLFMSTIIAGDDLAKMEPV